MSTLWILVRQALRNLASHPVLNLAATFIVGVSLFVVAAFSLLLVNVESIGAGLGQDTTVVAWIQDGITESEIETLKAEISSLPDIRGVEIISRDEALRRFQAAFEGVAGLLDDLGDNPLPASLEIAIRPGLSPREIDALILTLKRPAFEELDYGQAWSERFGTFVQLLRVTLTGLSGLLLAAAALMIINTIHLTVYARRDELDTLRLVGATPWFIRLPFMIEGFIQGLLGGLLAVGALWLVHRWASPRLESWIHLLMGAREISFLSLPLLLRLVFGGVVMAVVANIISVQRFLRQRVGGSG